MKQIFKNWAYFLFGLIPLFLLRAFVRSRIAKVSKDKVIEWYAKTWEARSLPPAHDSMLKALEEAGVEMEIRDEAIRTLSPVIRTSAPIIFAMIGLPQTGKSTVANAFAKACGAMVAENNDIRVNMKNGAFPNVNEVSFLLASIAIGRGYNVVLDSDFANPAKQRMLEAFASGVGARVIYLRVSCDKAVWKERMRKPGYVFGQLYHQAISPDLPDDAIGVDIGQIIRDSLIRCVEGEYERQEPDHRRSPPKNTIEFLTGTTKSIVELTARNQAWRVLSSHGGTLNIRKGFHELLEKKNA